MIGAVIFAIIFLSVFVGGISIFLFIIRGRVGGRRSYNTRVSGENAVKLKKAQKALSKNPNDITALITIGDIFFGENVWEQAYSNYSSAFSNPLLETKHPESYYKVCLNMGLCSLNLRNYDDAKLLLEKAISKYDDFECNYSLGYINYIKKSYDVAVQYFMRAKAYDLTSSNTTKYLGMCLYELRRFTSACDYLKKAYSQDSEDKEIIYYLSICLYELKQNPQALQYFKLIADSPKYGANVKLLTGLIYYEQKKSKSAITEFLQVVQFPDVDMGTFIEAKYYLALCYLKEQNSVEANKYLKDIYSINPEYKDVYSLLNKTGEFVDNKGLSEYLGTNVNKFLSICKKLCVNYFPKDAKVKILDSHTNKDGATFIIEVHTSKFEDVVLFRFIKSSSIIGDLSLKEASIEAKDVKASKIICFCAGHFSEEAKRYVEARLIDLIEKPKLTKMLKKAVK